jgi:signal transduction histidine kinase/ActR/RegA family two-component response regulator
MKLNLLITTDASEYAGKVTAQLRAAGLDCSSATVSTPAEFLGLDAAKAPDLILLDYGLKSWSGEAALKAAAETFPGTPCVVLTEGLGEKELAALLKNKAAGCLAKAPLAKLAAGLLLDITEIRKAGDRLSSEKRLEAVGRLAGGLAHDFHNLLSSVLGYSTLMLGNMGAEDPLREDLNEIYKAAERAVVLTRQLLVFSKKQAYQPQLLDLNSVFTGMQTMIRQLMRDDVRGVSDMAEGLPAVKADLVQIEQVIIGLAMNVCELIPPGGTLTVSTKTADVGTEYCKTVPGAAPGAFVLFSVGGTGKALDKETLESIFEPYAHGSAERRGATLALPAIYGIVKQHGGWITVRSEEGAGTVFEVYLPVPAEETAPAPEPGLPPAVRKIGGNGERILLVEDEEALRKFVGRVLRENGYTVFAAGSVKETLEIFRREKGNFHLVFTDVSLPDKTGVQLAEELLAIKPALKIIFNSGYVNEKSQWPAIQQKGLKFLQKPYTIHNMLTAIKEVIKRPEA